MASGGAGATLVPTFWAKSRSAWGCIPHMGWGGKTGRASSSSDFAMVWQPAQAVSYLYRKYMYNDTLNTWMMIRWHSPCLKGPQSCRNAGGEKLWTSRSHGRNRLGTEFPFLYLSAFKLWRKNKELKGDQWGWCGFQSPGAKEPEEVRRLLA